MDVVSESSVDACFADEGNHEQTRGPYKHPALVLTSESGALRCSRDNAEGCPHSSYPLRVACARCMPLALVRSLQYIINGFKLFRR